MTTGTALLGPVVPKGVWWESARRVWAAGGSEEGER